MTVSTQAAADYSAHGEQAIILDVLAKQGAIKDRGRFLDIGAGDGLVGSCTRALSDQGWEGVLVEADPTLWLRLRGNHSGNDKMNLVLARVVDRVRDPGDGRPGISEARIRPLPSGGWVGAVTAQELALVFGGRYELVRVRGAESILVATLGPVLSHTRLVCYEVEAAGAEAALGAWAARGFTERVAVLPGGSTLLCREASWPGYGEQGERRGEAVKAASVEALLENGVVRKWELADPAQRRDRTPSTADPAVLADPKARMARARSFMKVSPAEAGRRGAAARARREVKP